ncbi:hypothetical protein L1987_47523 [Smallanthus sonchifolius]|uniref:Uncharacterized protein n=1 Tax=Smallanthus sonchifolius TaxID=185202 RepID=A0ACB9G3R0_9ASTR|nr:hypothetical protein L1987_47523 [Smallanthus sonchifolius]
MFEHEHPLTLKDLWSKQQQHEEESEEDEEENDDDLIAKQDFRSLCILCEEEINWFHRYYYTCCQCDYSFHQFCVELPERWEDICHAHTLYFLQQRGEWWCDICYRKHKPHHSRYHCSQCDFNVDVNCVVKEMLKNTMHHPSHIHPLVCMTKQILSKCDACGEEHKGTFYRCTMCPHSFIHKDCAFLPKKLQIQHTTNNFYSHIHPLTLEYSFPDADQSSKNFPRCRVCLQYFYNENLWIYKCEKCRYYTHLNCATSRNESFMSILTSPGTYT